jgi:hypothetical protein
MRITTILAAGAALMLATAAGAQQQPAPQPEQPSTQQPDQQAPSTAPTIQSINIVDIDQLPQETKAQVNTIVSQRSDADLQKLRSSIDATPQVKSALEAKGLTSAQVIAASLDDKGALTLITKKKAG